MDNIKLISPIINVGDNFFLGEYNLDNLSDSTITVIRNELKPKKTVFTNIRRLRIMQNECIITDGRKSEFYLVEEIEKYISDKIQKEEDVICLNGNIIYHVNEDLPKLKSIVDFFNATMDKLYINKLIKINLTWAYKVKKEIFNANKKVLNISI